MTLDMTTIQAKFDSVCKGECTRETASNWARELRESYDRNELLIVPETEQKRIWEALIFLEGYDMKNSPTEYLYAEEDLIANRPDG